MRNSTMNKVFRLVSAVGVYLALFLIYEYASQLPGWVKVPRAWSIAGAVFLTAYALELWYKSRPAGEKKPKLMVASKFFPRTAAFLFFIAILESR